MTSDIYSGLFKDQRFPKKFKLDNKSGKESMGRMVNLDYKT